MAGILFVTIHPDPDLPPSRFHEWYNNEHGPLRLRLPHIFLSGARLRAADALAPAFLAVYDVTNVAHLHSDTYTALRTDRSPRESTVIDRVQVRRSFYRLVHAVNAPERSPSTEALQVLDLEPPLGSISVAAEVTFKQGQPRTDAALAAWLTQLTAHLPASKHWLRSRLFRASDSVSDLQVLPGEEHPPSRYLILHELLPGADPSSLPTSDGAGVIATEDRRTWSLFYRFGPCPRDLESLSLLGPQESFTSPDSRTSTHAGPNPIIESYITTPSSSSSSSSSKSTSTSTSITIPYRLEGNPAPDAPVVAFSNSLLTSLHMWDPLITILKSTRPDLKLLRYDTRGRHNLPNPSSSPTSPADLPLVTADLIALLDALRIPSLHALIGVSMGALTTLNLAIHHPSRLAKFIACDFNCASSPANTSAWKDRIALAEQADAHAHTSAGNSGIRSLAQQTAARWFHPNAARTKPDAVRAITDMVAQNSVQGFRNSCTVLWDYDLRPALGKCATPGLLIVGSHDGNGALVSAMQGFRGLIGEGATELRIVPETGHLPMYEDPEAFWQVVRDFI